MGRASNLVAKISSWSEDDWVLLRHHYPKEVERFAALLRDGPPRESDETPTAVGDPSPPPVDSGLRAKVRAAVAAGAGYDAVADAILSLLPGDADLCKLTDGTWRLRLSDGTWAACDSPTGPRAETLLAGECWRGRPMVSEISDLVHKHREVSLTDQKDVENHLSQTVQILFALFAGRSLTPDEERSVSRDPVPEGPAPLHELRQDSAAMLQLRRDVKWLEDRGFRGQTRVSDFSTTDMVGLGLHEFETLSLGTRQRFENRAYTALRVLNGGTR